jgi:hypothetical protein
LSLGLIANVKFGIKSGCDGFFFPRDITEEVINQNISDHEFKERYGIGRPDSQRIRIIRAGDGSVHQIEARYLKPEVHSLMGLDSIEVNLESLERKIFLVSEPKGKLKDTYALKYIRWGEREKFHERPTCASRSLSRFWYDLAPNKPGIIFWPLAHQYRHIIPLNEKNLISNKRLFNIYPLVTVSPLDLCAILNSTLVALTKTFFGRFVGREGNLDTEVFDAKMMLVPDPRQATHSVRKRLEFALDSMRKRKALPLVDVDSSETDWTGELALEDRQQLDDTVLELLGIADPRERAALRDEIYEEITNLYRQIRVAERKMQHHRSATARGGRATPQSIAEEIWEARETPFIYRTLTDFLPKGIRTEEFDLSAGRARIVKGNWFEPDGVRVNGNFLELGDPIRCQFVIELNKIGITGSIRVPIQPTICQTALDDYHAYVEQITEEFKRLAAAYTAEDVLQERVVRELWRKTKA